MKSKQPSSKSKPSKQPPTPEEKLALSQNNQAKYERVAADPQLSPEAAAWAKSMARGFAAETRMREKAQTYLDPNSDQGLAQLLNLHSPPGQLPSSDPTSLLSSTKPGTSDSKT